MGIYRISDNNLEKYDQKSFSANDYEKQMEEWIERNPGVLFDGEKILWIGRQVRTSRGKWIDLLGLDQGGNSVIVELKRGLTPRETVAQALEYSAWVASREKNEIGTIAGGYFKRRGLAFSSLDDAMKRTFGPTNTESESFNEFQRIVIVGEEIPVEVKDIAQYLRDFSVNIYCWKFSYHVSDSGDRIIHTNMEVGGEEGFWERQETDRNRNKKRENRPIVMKLIKELNGIIDLESDNLVHPFQKYEPREGSGIVAFIDFKIQDLVVAVDVFFENSRMMITFFARKKPQRGMLVDWLRDSEIKRKLPEFEFKESEDRLFQRSWDLSEKSSDEKEKILFQESRRLVEAIRDML